MSRARRWSPGARPPVSPGSPGSPAARPGVFPPLLPLSPRLALSLSWFPSGHLRLSVIPLCLSRSARVSLSLRPPLSLHVCCCVSPPPRLSVSVRLPARSPPLRPHARSFLGLPPARPALHQPGWEPVEPAGCTLKSLMGIQCLWASQVTLQYGPTPGPVVAPRTLAGVA